MRPSVGRIVHYVSHGTPIREDGTQAYSMQCRAAVITEAVKPEDALYASRVSLAVLNPEGMFFNRDVLYHEGVPFDDEHPELAYPGGTWHWPERVD